MAKSASTKTTSLDAASVGGAAEGVSAMDDSMSISNAVYSITGISQASQAGDSITLPEPDIERTYTLDGAMLANSSRLSATNPVGKPTKPKYEPHAAARIKALKRKVDNLNVKCRRADRRLQKWKEKIPKREDCIRILSHYLPRDAFTFVKTQILMSARVATGYRWDDDDKFLAHSIYSASPKAYEILSSIFILPSIGVLRKNARAKALKAPQESEIEEVCIRSTEDEEVYVPSADPENEGYVPSADPENEVYVPSADPENEVCVRSTEPENEDMCESPATDSENEEMRASPVTDSEDEDL